jgi:hypothetical protein
MAYLDRLEAQGEKIRLLIEKASGLEIGGGDTDLPTGCRRVDYIKFSGEQIVDTGIVCNQDTKIHVIFTREASNQEYLYGVASSGNTASVTAYLGGSWRFGNKYATKPVSTVRTELGYFVFVDKSEICVTGSITAISGVNDFETIGTLLIGTCRSSDGSVGNPQYDGKIYTFVMWNGSERVLKLIPVVDAEGNYHFWDEIGKKFHDSITDTPLEGGNL